FNTVWKDIEAAICDYNSRESELEPRGIQQYDAEVGCLRQELIASSDTLVKYLIRINTSESSEEKSRHLDTFIRRKGIVDRFLAGVAERMLEAVENISHKMASEHNSRSSKRSGTSTSPSVILLEKQLNVERQKTRLEFLKHELTLEKKKSQLELDLRLLKQEQETAVAEAEAKVARDHITPQEFHVKEERHSQIPKNEIVSRFLSSLDSQSSEGFVKLPPPNFISTPHEPVLEVKDTDPPRPSAMPDPNPGIGDFTSFLLKKDLLTSRFMAFTDQPEAYTGWKTSFQGILKELRATPGEELDLLIKWLGAESKKFAMSMRTANPKDPQKAVRLIWQRLQERYGSPELVEAALKSKLDKFPSVSISDSKKLYELADLLTEIDSVKEDPTYSTLLSYFDSSSGILPVVRKLPVNIQKKWITRASAFKRHSGQPHPPFKYFVDFIMEMSQIRNDPGLCLQDRRKENIPVHRPERRVINRKTDLEASNSEKYKDHFDPRKKCPIHPKDFHALNKCRTFRIKPMKERTDILVRHGICFKCCNSTEHFSRNCNEKVTCSVCASDAHPSALHVDQRSPQGGERKQDSETKATVNSKCAQICGGIQGGKSCSKTILVNVYPQGEPNNFVKTYALIDDQSNCSLAKSELFEMLNINSETKDYQLQTCSGVKTMTSRIAKNLVVASPDGRTKHLLPPIVECDDIPNNRDEIATPALARRFQHLSDIACHIPELDSKAKILLLIGRDLIVAHHVHDQRISHDAPYAQKLSLGWTIIGETCLNKAHLPVNISVNKIYLHDNGRPSILRPSNSSLTVKDPCIDQEQFSSVFERTPNDDKPGPSQEDIVFLDIMESEFHRNQVGEWTAPLPFKPGRPRLPNNYTQAVKRAKNLDSNLRKNPTKMDHALTFMEGIFTKGHAEIAPPLHCKDECWYLPIFAIYHPKKPGKIRMVFDSSASYDGISLNSVLLSGPDLTNNLLGVLLRFRKERIAVMADIEQMFYCFRVAKDHQNYLRFLWYKNNYPSNELIEYRMTVHVFGNTPSPSVATYGLRQSVADHPDPDIRELVHRSFYVDDLLVSVPVAEQAVKLIRKTQEALMEGGKLRLHKVASNSQEVMSAFDEGEKAKDLKYIDLRLDEAPLQKSLGLTWDLQTDSFTVDVSLEQKPFTKRGMLSTLNSLYDPIGFISPVTLKGKILFRKALNSPSDWDDPLPPEFEDEWRNWCDSLEELAHISIPRPYTSSGLQDASRVEVHIFCDASEIAISAVAYLKVVEMDHTDIGFVLGKSKLAPAHGHTVPLLELCAAVLASEIANIVTDNLDSRIDHLQFYSDSRIVLGYLYNTSRRFYTYVSNRVQKVLKLAPASHWTYVQSAKNPADIGSRSISARDLQSSEWIKGPDILSSVQDDKEEFHLVDADHDSNVRPQLSTLMTVTKRPFGIERFQRFSTWKSLVNAISILRYVVLRRHGVHCDRFSSHFRRTTEISIFKLVQQETFHQEIANLHEGKAISKNSSIVNLDPYLDDDSILRVGGRLRSAEIDHNFKNPCIISRSHIARLLISHQHDMVQHQGRHYTEGAVRSAGYWIVGCKKLVSSVIYNCVICRKLRGRLEHQKMADLPSVRVCQSPPFTYVGVDMFGHWEVVTRKTRGGSANSKRWAILFTCLSSRASHIEVVEDMSSSAFINALRRFIAIRGRVAEFRSDRGTNFVGSIDALGISAVNVEDPTFKTFLTKNGCSWIFNAPHSSHMGGVWERVIGLARRILDAILLKQPKRQLTHDVLVTLMAEVTAILNNRPLVPVSMDPHNPLVLTPNMLLTQKSVADVPPFQELDIRDMYVSSWKHVQVIAQQFWKRWHTEYLQLLQQRRKWTDSKDNLQIDVVLLREKEAHRNDWSMGVINRTFPDEDGKVRKIEVRTNRGGQLVHYVRPITEVVLQVPHR
ncbi:uncharacterized protein LOC134264026, partial [Saccostrea cucullata]|uniref:uncharacterized protein LOC134264026 n=1 Tax=Saccostrea cuccullata TaxID=36930 RepID=UPI002ED28CC1